MKTIDEYVKTNKYNEKQLKEIKLGLKSKVDVSVYDNYMYHWSQMKQIRLGLERKKEDEKENG